MQLPGFHPLVSRWFTETLGAPTAAQERGWASIRQHRHTLIAAPTGSGKTLAAFLTAIDDLVREGGSGALPDEVRVVYVSPLKALSADIHKNLAEPRRGIQQLASMAGIALPPITAAVRTGDTSASERAGMLRTPPHILVTTPESLYLLLTSDRSRRMLRTARIVIVDEIHAVIGTRRGAHLALSLERLQQEAERPLLRLGLSATQKPVEEVARYLVGSDGRRGDCAIVDEGHRRALDLAIEMPRSPLDAVMAQEVWEEYYDRLAELIESHTTTLVFVNTRRLAERVARHLSDRIGADKVTAHHGSLSKDTRLDAENRLKTGTLKALVATASLELGIDIGHVDLVCQIGSPHRIATLLQRVGRAGHTVHGVSKGRLLPTSRDDLVECIALLRSVRRGDLDRVVSHDAPLDVLAQQIAAEVTCREYVEDELYTMVRNAWPYRELTRADFDAVVGMVAEGFSTRRGRRAALVHRDEVHATLRGRRSTRLLALTSGGAIPEVADYRVILEPEDTFIGTLNEDFAIESMAGDIFQLGNASWRITQVAAGVVRVADAHGAPPNIPFWFGEAPARSDELSKAVSELRADAERWLVEHPGASGEGNDALAAWMQKEAGICEAASAQTADYFADGWRALGVIPSQGTLVLERFFDESGGMQLVLHAPFGSRINRAWGLALRKRFCRQFNFELQAAATEDALLLSLGPQHSFPLADVFRYLHAATVRDILVQAFLDAPVFQTRWRWNATISLAVPRYRGGRKVPPQIQRMQSEDLMAAVFPDAAACLENIPGDREIPDHPLVRQTVRDCLEEAMDLQGLTSVLTRIHAGTLRCVARDMPEPSVFAHEILNARPYAFLDDAPLEERRTQAVQTRRTGNLPATDLGALDASAIARVIDEERLDPRDAEELHDALLTVGCLADAELCGSGLGTRGPGPETLSSLGEALVAVARATHVQCGTARLFVAAERLPELLAVHPDAVATPPVTPPGSRTVRVWSRAEALRELLRGRLAIVGPTTVGALAMFFAVGDQDVEEALLALEGEGAVLRGSFTPGTRAPEWCDRRLLSRIHRYTLNRLRAEIAPVSPAEFMRFLFVWQHVDQPSTLTGIEGLRAVLAQLDGTELPARAWERHVLPARVQGFEPAMLDMLCLTGEVAWARLSTGPTQVVGATPIAIFLREHADSWLALRSAPDEGAGVSRSNTHADVASGLSRTVLDYLRARGASFSHDIAAACSLTGDDVRTALCELVANGIVSSDGFAGLRAIVGDTTFDSRRARADHSGRWFALETGTSSAHRSSHVDMFAWALLRRYGVVFRRLLAREATDVPWRDLARVYRRLEARGEIRGGRFVTGMSGEQFALPDAVERLREVRRSAPDGRLIAISAADPLNLTGLLTSEERVRVATANRIVYRNGVPLAAMEGDMLRTINTSDPDISAEAAALAAGRRVPVLSGYVGRIR
ncbi:MAG TPA: DEAD/DEAH box helicase [Vicinamibacterales bacterium]|nr:DEAD/DEAH box helicase [Vicinamibacterales bacterium]